MANADNLLSELFRCASDSTANQALVSRSKIYDDGFYSLLSNNDLSSKLQISKPGETKLTHHAAATVLLQTHESMMKIHITSKHEVVKVKCITLGEATDMQRTSTIMLVGWSLRESLLKLLKKCVGGSSVSTLIKSTIASLKIVRKGNIDGFYLSDDDDDAEENEDDPFYKTDFLTELDRGALTYPTRDLCEWGWSFIQKIDYQAPKEMTSEDPYGYTDLLNDVNVKNWFAKIVKASTMQNEDDSNEEKNKAKTAVVEGIQQIMMSKILNARSGMIIKHYKENISELRTIHLRDKLKAANNK